jgi:hypothetical protein
MADKLLQMAPKVTMWALFFGKANIKKLSNPSQVKTK